MGTDVKVRGQTAKSWNHALTLTLQFVGAERDDHVDEATALDLAGGYLEGLKAMAAFMSPDQREALAVMLAALDGALSERPELRHQATCGAVSTTMMQALHYRGSRLESCLSMPIDRALAMELRGECVDLRKA